MEEVHASDQSKVYQSPGMVKSQSVGTISHPQVDRGVGFPRLVKSSSSNSFTTNFNLDPGTEVCINDLKYLFFYFHSTRLMYVASCFSIEVIINK